MRCVDDKVRQVLSDERQSEMRRMMGPDKGTRQHSESKHFQGTE